MTREQLKAMHPGCAVFKHADDALDVYRGETYVAAWRKSGAGNWVNASVECGAENEEAVEPDENHAVVKPTPKKKKAAAVTEESEEESDSESEASTEPESDEAPKKKKKKKS